MSRSAPWLAPFTWKIVTAQNAVLCQEPTRELWKRLHTQPMNLDDAVDLCRRCHQMAPFCFYNGNTFTAIIRDVVTGLSLPAEQAYIIRSLAGHIVAGVSTGEEEKAFREFCESLDAPE